MMTTSPLFSTPWISRTAAILLLAAVLLIVYLWVIAPLRAAYVGADARIEEVKDLVTRTERIAADRDVLRAESQRLSSQPETAIYYLTGETEAVAAAALQARITSVIGNSGGNLGSVQALPGTDDNGLRRIAVRVQMVAGIGSLLNVLHGLETGLPLLFVGNLDVQSQLSPMAAVDVPQAEPMLTVSAEIYGYLPPAGVVNEEAVTP